MEIWIRYQTLNGRILGNFKAFLRYSDAVEYVRRNHKVLREEVTRFGSLTFHELFLDMGDEEDVASFVIQNTKVE